MAPQNQIRRVTLIVAAIALLAGRGRAAVASEAALLKIALDPQAGVVERTRAFADLQAVATEGSLPAIAALLNDPAWAYPARAVLEAVPGAGADRALLRALESAEVPALRAGLVNSLG